ncbi:ATP synthase F1 subunit delta [Dissulfurimicrobium sp.]|uniref:ATP synthase F1 subunit delta n=1 Tax=Dissulfurimicrobium sp. TaxID=2022436 RepID=UPI003D13F3E3
MIAKRYAKALFFVAKESGKLTDFGATLKEISVFLARNPDVELALVSPVYPLGLKQDIVNQLIKAFKVEDVLANFLRLLVERRRIQNFTQICQSFSELVDEEMGVVRAVVKTVVPMPKDLQGKFAEILAKISGKKVALELQEDPSIIGGVVASIGDMVWDGSIRSQLQGFRESIERGDLG